MSKIRRLTIPFLIVLLACCWVVPAGAQPPDFAALAAKLKPAVVNISTEKTVKPRMPSFREPEAPGGTIHLMSSLNDFSEVRRSLRARPAHSVPVLSSRKTAIS